MKYFRLIAVIFVTFMFGKSSEGQSNIFVSPNASSQSDGSLDHPFASISEAVEHANAGDTIFLLPGRYLGTTTLRGVNGKPNQPIVITAYDLDQVPVIDAQAEPSNDGFAPGIALDSCRWITISAIKFENCWFSVIDIDQSNYISIEFCHFTSGKYTVHPHGLETHHVLVENCIIKHPPQVWKGWSWLEMHHGEIQYYNGALIHPRKSAGGHIMRNNELHNMFNGFRTRPADIREDGNTEIYANKFFNVRDNEFEPESWAWNMHYYHNDHVNVHKLFSIDGVEGGYIYIYGNTYTQSDDPWTNYQVSGIYKYKNGPLTWPCYVFNNSFYTTARVMKYGESSNHQMKHFNNAYQFFETKNAFRVVDWQPGYEFDYDCINQGWPENILAHHQEKHGKDQTNPGFIDPQLGVFTLSPSSLCIDAGKVMNLPELEWRQSYEGHSPDIGAYDGQNKVEGPPFRFIPSPEGAYYHEYPRISRHYLLDKKILLYFSAPIANDDFNKKILFHGSGQDPIKVTSSLILDGGFALLLETERSLQDSDIAISIDSTLHGLNHLPVVSWGSTIKYNIGSRKPDLEFPDLWSDELPEINEIKIDYKIDHEANKLIVEMQMDPILPIIYRGILGFSTEEDVYLDGAYPEYTDKGAIYSVDISNCEKGNYELTLLIAGQLFKKKIILD
ncbi:MAG: hypothetical protein KDC53_05880 [Saprospiraceae bacterium]|nr:hypothetical protein [Saprospiraceae bacterium]